MLSCSRVSTNGILSFSLAQDAYEGDMRTWAAGSGKEGTGAFEQNGRNLEGTWAGLQVAGGNGTGAGGNRGRWRELRETGGNSNILEGMEGNEPVSSIPSLLYNSSKIIKFGQF